MRDGKWKHLLIALGLALALLSLVAGLPLASRAQGPAPQGVAAPLGTAFTYQGRLTDGGNPADGAYDFRFSLYDSSTGSTQIGSMVTKSGITVTGGLFSVELDFGNVFDGTALWLEVAVKKPSESSYTTLGRQKLTAAPYAAYARSAPWSGLTGMPAGFADGTDDGLTRVTWTDIQSRPAGLDDGDDDTTYSAGAGLALTGTRFSVLTGAIQSRVSGSCPAGQSIRAVNQDGSVVCEPDDGVAYSAGEGITVTTGNTISVQFAGSGVAATAARSDHNHDDAYQQKYVRTIVVSPVGDGSNPTANGTALLNALNSITATTSLTYSYLLKIEPGIYDVGNSPLQMKPYVDLEGSGQKVTVIKGAGQSVTTTGVIVGSDAEIRNLTVESYGGDAYAIALYNPYTLTLRNVTINAYDATTENIGIMNVALLDVYYSNVYADGAVSDGYAPAHAVGVRSENTGVIPFTFLRFLGSEAGASADAAGTVGIGIELQSSFAESLDSQIYAFNLGSSTAYAFYSDSSSLAIRNVVAGNFLTDYGLWFRGSGMTSLNVDVSMLRGATYSLYNDGGSSKIGTSQLDGAITNTVTGGGSLTCIYVYDGNYAAATCP